MFNFDIRQSMPCTCPRLACSSIASLPRAAQKGVAPEAANVETRQNFPWLGSGLSSLQTFLAFSVKGPDGSVLSTERAQFSDSRESGFRQAANGRIENHSVESIRQSHATGEFLDPVWLLACGGPDVVELVLTGARAPPRAA